MHSIISSFIDLSVCAGPGSGSLWHTKQRLNKQLGPSAPFVYICPEYSLHFNFGYAQVHAAATAAFAAACANMVALKQSASSFHDDCDYKHGDGPAEWL